MSVVAKALNIMDIILLLLYNVWLASYCNNNDIVKISWCYQVRCAEFDIPTLKIHSTLMQCSIVINNI